jgi:hypothetical protein
MSSCDIVKTSEAQAKRFFTRRGLIDKYLNILDLGGFRRLNTQESELATNTYGIAGRLFLEDLNGTKAVPNKEMFQTIDFIKGIRYKENYWVGKRPAPIPKTPIVAIAPTSKINPVIQNTNLTLSDVEKNNKSF